MNFKEMKIEDLLKLMAGASRLDRKNAAKQISALIKENPSDYVKFIPHLIDALARPEAQTRWECLNSLARLVELKPEACAKAIEDAEIALFDEKTSLVRVAAIRFLCRYGALNVQNSKDVWDIIKEAILRFHGEIEFDEMLNYVIYFARGKISTKVKNELKEIVDEQIASVGGGTKMRLQMVLDALDPKKKKKPSKKINKASKTARKSVDKKTSTKKPVKKVAKKATSKSTKKPTKKTVKKPAKKLVKKAVKKTAKKTVKKVAKNAVKKAVKKSAKQPKKSSAKKLTKKPKNSKKTK